MSQNPLEGLGGNEGFDISALMQQAQQMQAQLVAAQEQLSETLLEGTVPGGSLTVKVNGTGELVSVEIVQGEFDGNDPDDLEDLGALIVAAYRDAKSKADVVLSETMGPLTGGLGGGLGGGGGDTPFKLGF